MYGAVWDGMHVPEEKETGRHHYRDVLRRIARRYVDPTTQTGRIFCLLVPLVQIFNLEPSRPNPFPLSNWVGWSIFYESEPSSSAILVSFFNAIIFFLFSSLSPLL